MSKGFKGAAYVSDFIKKEKMNNPITFAPITFAPITFAPITFAPITFAPITFAMKLNGETRQVGNTKNMIFSFKKIISFLSSHIQLRRG
ncbi:MAG: fumarylacetoacetate hydrolase family protein, partial [Bartonella sp.]|nr:fumarylacetoacetate hydrolase family protein [Bartonella sp.]